MSEKKKRGAWSVVKIDQTLSNMNSTEALVGGRVSWHGTNILRSKNGVFKSVRELPLPTDLQKLEIVSTIVTTV